MDKQITKHQLRSTPEDVNDLDFGFEIPDDPIVLNLIDKACFLSDELIDSLEPRASKELRKLETCKRTIIQTAIRRLEEGSFGHIESKNEAQHTVRASEEAGVLVVENVNHTENRISTGMAMEAVRWMNFDDVTFDLGRHETEALKKIISSSAMGELEAIRDEEIGIVMIHKTEGALSKLFEIRMNTLATRLQDKRGGEIAEELVASFLRTLSADGILPFEFEHADIQDDVMHKIDLLFKTPYEHIPVENQKPGRGSFNEAIQFTVNRDVKKLDKKAGWVAGVVTKARNANRAEEEQIDRADLLQMHFPHHEDDYVRTWANNTKNNFRGPEMALDHVTRNLIIEKIMDRVCWYWNASQKKSAIEKMGRLYSGMYMR